MIMTTVTAGVFLKISPPQLAVEVFLLQLEAADEIHQMCLGS